jgi:hypothetical protein
MTLCCVEKTRRGRVTDASGCVVDMYGHVVDAQEAETKQSAICSFNPRSL